MDLLERLTADHDEAAALIGQLAPLAADDAQATEATHLVMRLAVLLETHARAEEHVLHERMRTASPELARRALEGAYEHQALEHLISRLVVHRPGPELAAILRVIERLFVQHARIGEETELFPLVRVALPADELVRLGHDLATEAQRLRPVIERLVGAPHRGPTESRRHLHIHNHGHRRG